MNQKHTFNVWPSILITTGLAIHPLLSQAQMPAADIELPIQDIVRHNRLDDTAFLSRTFGLNLRMMKDGQNGFRAILLSHPTTVFASGLSFSVQQDSAHTDRVRLHLFPRQCPDEVRLAYGLERVTEHPPSPDFTRAVSLFTPPQPDGISLTLIYHKLGGVCEVILSQQVPHRKRMDDNASPPLQGNSEGFSRSLASALSTADLRMHREVAARLNMELEEILISQDGATHQIQQLILEKNTPGIDSEFFSYVIRDSGWQPLTLSDGSPEILANKRVDIHIPLDAQSLCPSLADIEQALKTSGVRWRRTPLSRNVWRWEHRGDNLVSLTATRHGRCLDAFDLTQITDLAHSLPETLLFNLPAGKTPLLGTENRSLLQRIVYRLQNDGQSSLDFIAQLPSTARMEDFERMDKWLGVLRQAFARQGVPEDAMEFHLYPPAAADAPARVFLMVLRRFEKCVPAEGALSASATCR